MKYQNINELDSRIERIVKHTVKHYYTDWKNYDRPKYMHFKASNQSDDKELILIARECGTYLIKVSDLEDKNSWASTLYNYFQDQEKADYYRINLNKLTVVKEIAA
jgi:hypothetical protein